MLRRNQQSIFVSVALSCFLSSFAFGAEDTQSSNLEIPATSNSLSSSSSADLSTTTTTTTTTTSSSELTSFSSSTSDSTVVPAPTPTNLSSDLHSASPFSSPTGQDSTPKKELTRAQRREIIDTVLDFCGEEEFEQAYLYLKENAKNLKQSAQNTLYLLVSMGYFGQERYHSAGGILTQISPQDGLTLKGELGKAINFAKKYVKKNKFINFTTANNLYDKLVENLKTQDAEGINLAQEIESLEGYWTDEAAKFSKKTPSSTNSPTTCSPHRRTDSPRKIEIAVLEVDVRRPENLAIALMMMMWSGIPLDKLEHKRREDKSKE